LVITTKVKANYLTKIVSFRSSKQDNSDTIVQDKALAPDFPDPDQASGFRFQQMIISKQNRRVIYEALFKGVFSAA
jgi:hypothetical protein